MKTLGFMVWFAVQLGAGCYITYAAPVAIWSTDRVLAVIVAVCLAAQVADFVLDTIHEVIENDDAA